LRRRIRDLRLKHFVRAANVGQFLDSLLDFMRRCQDELVGPTEYALYVKRLERGEVALPRVARSKKQTELEEVGDPGALPGNRSRFCHRGKHAPGRKPGHLRPHDHQGLSVAEDRSRGCSKRNASRTRFLLVDEFQDANFAQVEILSLLAGPEANVFAVGDADQAIYQFRGASSEAFTLFMRNFPAARVVALEKNRRSLSPILGCAFGIVNENPTGVRTERSRKKEFQLPTSVRPLESLRDEEAKLQGQTTSRAAGRNCYLEG
jgi:hypothetical protein